MRYKFKVTEDGKPEEEKEEMSFKKLLKSLVIPNPKWTGFNLMKTKKEDTLFIVLRMVKEYDGGKRFKRILRFR